MRVRKFRERFDVVKKREEEKKFGKTKNKKICHLKNVEWSISISFSTTRLAIAIVVKAKVETDFTIFCIIARTTNPTNVRKAKQSKK